MAEAATRLYNLRSREPVVELPVQLHLADDEKFISDLLAGDRTQTGQVSGSDSSLSDNDCDALITSPLAKASGSGLPGCNTKHVSDPSLSDATGVSQQVINMQILSQLKSLGQRLDNMETKNYKKTSDQSKIKSKNVKKKVKSTDTPVTVAPNTSIATPDLNALRQLKVEQRLKELQETEKQGKLKSLRGGSVEVMVKHKVKWPHEYILSGSSKERVSYDQLSVIQWVAGFCRIMREEKNTDSKEFMLDYLVSLLDDAQDFSWEAAKASHAVLLCRMEQGEIENYSQIDKIDRIRRANAQRHIHPTVSPTKNLFKNLRKSCHASISTKVLVLTTKVMTQKVFVTIMSVLPALLMEKNFHILRWNAKTNSKKHRYQKTNKCGYYLGKSPTIFF